MSKILYSIDDAMMLLGCFANRPNLMLSKKYKIGENDFRCKGCDDSKFHHILYRTMYNLVASGAEEIDNVVVDTSYVVIQSNKRNANNMISCPLYQK